MFAFEVLCRTDVEFIIREYKRNKKLRLRPCRSHLFLHSDLGHGATSRRLDILWCTEGGEKKIDWTLLCKKGA